LKSFIVIFVQIQGEKLALYDMICDKLRKISARVDLFGFLFIFYDSLANTREMCH